MAQIVSVDAAKEFARVDGRVEDVLVASLIDAAIDVVEGMLGRTLIDPEKGWATADAVPAGIKLAIKIVVAHLYRFRDLAAVAQAAGEMRIDDKPILRLLLERHIVPSFA